MVVYYEVVFIDNFILNYLVLLFSSKLCALKVRTIKFVIVSAISAIISIIMIKYKVELIDSFFIKILFTLCFCFAFFGLSKRRLMVKRLVIFTTCCFLLSGVLFFFLNNSEIAMFSGYVVYSKVFVRRALFSIMFIILSYKIYIYLDSTSTN